MWNDLARPNLNSVRLTPGPGAEFLAREAGVRHPFPQTLMLVGLLLTAALRAGEPGAVDATATGPDPRLASCHEVLSDFFLRHEVPGAAVAITEQGRLVYAQGFGFADVEQRRRATPESLFRIASVSKPITAVAVLQLAERGRLSLEDRVFEILKYEPFLEGGATFDERQRQVTIRHLLQHRGGWDRQQSIDPMFQSVRFAQLLHVPPPAAPRDIIRVMLGRRLDFDPGGRYAYSNYGYCLLGRVIEVVSGTSYEQYVRDQVLAPLGIGSMRLGKTRLQDRGDPNEVKYYDRGLGPSVFAADLGQSVPRPYGAFCLEAMDAHGGWLASVVDLARFATAFDDPGRCPILSHTSIERMLARPAGQAGYDPDDSPESFYYSLGWMNRILPDQRRINRWHNGSLPGTTAILIRRHDGHNMVALLNTRLSPRTDDLKRDLDRVLHQAADKIEPCPEIDLFH